MLLSVLIFTQCENNDEIQGFSNYENVTDELNTEFNLENFNNDYIKKNLEVNWSESIILKEDSININYLYQTNIFSNLHAPKTDFRIFYTYNILEIKDKKDLTSTFKIVKLLTDGYSTTTRKDLNLKKLNNFSGTVISYNLKGETLSLKGYKNGILKSELKDSPYSNTQTKNVPPLAEGCYLTQRIELYKDYYRPLLGGTIAGRPSEWQYTHTTYEGSNYQQFWVSDCYSSGNYPSLHEHRNTSSGGHGGSNPGNLNNNANCSDEIIFDPERTSTFLNNDKVNCTYERLLDTNTLGTILTDFFGDDAQYNLTFDIVSDLPCSNTDAVGCTYGNSNSPNINIDIDLEYINNNKTATILIAQTLIHEAIHANLYAAVKKYNNGQEPLDSSFEALYESYRTMNNWQHEYMADHYTSIIAQALREVHGSLNDQQLFDWYNDNSEWSWDNFYETLSYIGLQNTINGSIYYAANESEISFYQNGAETFSTKSPNCDE
ncbi:hypothetical protein ACFSYG_19230 [Leeuwenhoekiella polynyae]|uniref:Uncharacterized protein n=1 Tax=Leeuwenhoekiella polynyae TaxID=1550906 RepID=A0A4V1KRL4_9FLAO|nr:hypothetical protein [Leeuwenhoekiella polynyae]RXG25322.1 hypothetical protein DSM02_1292 [Leeuwenhoekiella polynyae]